MQTGPAGEIHADPSGKQAVLSSRFIPAPMLAHTSHTRTFGAWDFPDRIRECLPSEANLDEGVCQIHHSALFLLRKVLCAFSSSGLSFCGDPWTSSDASGAFREQSDMLRPG